MSTNLIDREDWPLKQLSQRESEEVLTCFHSSLTEGCCACKAKRLLAEHKLATAPPFEEPFAGATSAEGSTYQKSLQGKFKRLAFRRCANCDHGGVLRAVDPRSTGFKYWCWTCGAKDEEVLGTPKLTLDKLDQIKVRLIQARLKELENV